MRNDRLKVVSLLTGASDATYLNSKSEIATLISGSVKSNAQEKMYVINRIIDELSKYGSLKERFSCIEEAVVYVLEKLLCQKEFEAVYKRVILFFYTRQEKSTQVEVENAIIEFINDSVIYIQNT